MVLLLILGRVGSSGVGYRNTGGIQRLMMEHRGSMPMGGFTQIYTSVRGV